MSGPAQPKLRLSVPPDGIRAGDLILRFPRPGDVDAILPAFTDPELLPTLAERGRLLAGIEHVAAYVNVGNASSQGVVDRAGFTREGVVRSMPKPDGRRVDKTLYSLLPGE